MERLTGKHAKPIHFAGSMVLGMNDAIIEITGALAGMAWLFQNTTTVLLAGTMTGVAAALSMGASAYLEAKQDVANGSDKHPYTAGIITGSTYFLVTALLLAPFYFITSPFYAFVGTILVNVCIIAGFSYFVTRMRKSSFWHQFTELFCISMGVATIGILIGHGLTALGI